VRCEELKNISKKLQLACTLKNPCCGGRKISRGRLLLNILLGGNRGNFHRRLACVSVSYFLFDPTKLLNVYEALHYRENILWL
jgi:hypothetical protein